MTTCDHCNAENVTTTTAAVGDSTCWQCTRQIMADAIAHGDVDDWAAYWQQVETCATDLGRPLGINY